MPLQGETDPKTLKLHSIGSFVYSNTEISESDLYTDTETDYSDSDYYDEYDTDNDEYEYIEVSEYEVTESENEKTDKAIACLDKQAWKNKPQLSEVVEDYENPDGIGTKIYIVFNLFEYFLFIRFFLSSQGILGGKQYR